MINITICKTINVKLTKRNIDWYLSKGYKVVSGEYITVDTKDLMPFGKQKINAICDECGTEKVINNAQYQKSTTCKMLGYYTYYCNNCTQKIICRKSDDQFKEDLFNSKRDEFTPLETYKKSNEIILFRHNICEYEFKTTPGSLLHGTGCPRCYGNIKLDTAEFKKRVECLVGKEFQVLGEYKNSLTKIEMRHEECGNVFMIVPASFIKGTRCKKCSMKEAGFKNRLSNDEFSRKINLIYNGDIKLLGNYKKSNEKIKVKHESCGHIRLHTPNNLLNKKINCPICQGKYKKTHDIFLNEVFELVGDEYTVASIYEHANKSIKIKHKTCGKIFHPKPQNFLNGSRCPHCKISKGERRISEILDKLNVNFEREVTFNNCRNIRKLRFDFYVEKKLLIEYDGLQHFKPYFMYDEKMGKEWLIKTKENDQLKNNYCLENEKVLYRIPYTKMEKIEEILIDILINNKIIKDDDKYVKFSSNEFLITRHWDSKDYYTSNGGDAI